MSSAHEQDIRQRRELALETLIGLEAPVPGAYDDWERDYSASKAESRGDSRREPDAPGAEQSNPRS